MDITIPYSHIQEILKTKVVDKDELSRHMSIDEPEVCAFKECNPPKLRVTLSRLEPDNSIPDSEIVSFPVNEDSRIDMVISSKSGKPQRYHLRPIKVAYLWDLSRFGKVDVLRCGRFKRNDFLPVIKEDPLEMDLGVSREHSLICFFDSKVYYIDYGTSTKYLESQEKPLISTPVSHFGSKNGSWVYHEYSIVDCVKNRCVEWNVHSLIGIGTFFYNVIYQEMPLKLFHQFSFKYEWNTQEQFKSVPSGA